MSPELAVGLAAAALVLMVGIVAGFAAVVLLDTVVAWPPRPRHRRTVGAQYWVRSECTETAQQPIVGWSR
jgi:hypothetical protein